MQMLTEIKRDRHEDDITEGMDVLYISLISDSPLQSEAGTWRSLTGWNSGDLHFGLYPSVLPAITRTFLF